MSGAELSSAESAAPKWPSPILPCLAASWGPVRGPHWNLRISLQNDTEEIRRPNHVDRREPLWFWRHSEITSLINENSISTHLIVPFKQGNRRLNLGQLDQIWIVVPNDFTPNWIPLRPNQLDVWLQSKIGLFQRDSEFDYVFTFWNFKMNITQYSFIENH